MESIGEKLREARHNKKVSLEDVSRATRIKMEILEQLEADEFDRLAAPAYTKGFLKLYAEYLGLDSQSMVDAYLRSQGGLRRQGLHVETEKTVRARKPRELKLPLRSVGLVVVGLTVAVFVIVVGKSHFLASRASPRQWNRSCRRTPPRYAKADFDAYYQPKPTPAPELVEPATNEVVSCRADEFPPSHQSRVRESRLREKPRGQRSHAWLAVARRDASDAGRAGSRRGDCQHVRVHRRRRRRNPSTRFSRRTNCARRATARRLIMAGCLTQRYPKDLQKELPEVDAIVGLNEVPRIGEIVREILAKNGHTAAATFLVGPGEVCARLRRAAVSADAEALCLREDRRGLQSSVHVLQHPAHSRKTSQPGDGRRASRRFAGWSVRRRAGDQSDFAGHDVLRQGSRPAGAGSARWQGLLCELLREIQQIDGDFWVRLLYTHPYHWTDELIETIAACDKVCRYVDMPLQHINDEMLKRMRRETSGQVHPRSGLRRFAGAFRASRCARRSSSVFPGETEEQFEELLEFIEEAKFERLGMFQYSQEDHTPAGRMAGTASAKEKKKRYGGDGAAAESLARSAARFCWEDDCVC